MPFVCKRGGSHQLIETYRENGKVKQRVLANLGHADTIDKTEAWRPLWRQQLEELWRSFAIPLDGIDREIGKEIHCATHVRRILTLHTLRKMLPPAERVLAKARKDLDDLRHVVASATS
jgi:hypothetical protein